VRAGLDEREGRRRQRLLSDGCCQRSRVHDQDGAVAHGVGVAVLRVRNDSPTAAVRRAERHEHRQRKVVVLVLTIP